MGAKPGRDELVDLSDLLVEAHHLFGQGVDHLCGDLLPGDGGVLALGRFEGCLGQGFGGTDLAVTQPGRQPFPAGPAQGGGGLVAAEQNQRPCVAKVEDSFQGREYCGE